MTAVSRVLAADDEGGLDALVGVRGRHPHVDHDQAGAVLADRAQQLVAVGHGRGDVEAALGQEPGQPGPQQHRVLGDDYSHGSSAVIVVGPADRAVHVQDPVDRGGPLGQPAQPGAVAVGGSRPRARRR